MTYSPPTLIGSQTPRFRTVTDPGSSADHGLGQRAINLMATVGVTLDPGQEDFTRDSLVRRADGRWSASEVVDIEPRQNGKGVLLETRALLGMLVLKEPLLVWTAHEFSTAKQGFLRMRSYFDNWDHLRKRVKVIRQSTHDTEIVLRKEFGGSTLAFKARSGGSGRGFAGVAPLFLDEAFALTPEQVAAITYATRAARNPQIYYMSSAPLRTSEVLRDIVKRGRRGARGMVYYEWSSPGKYDETLRLIERNRDMSDEEAETPIGRELRAELMQHVATANRAFGVRIHPDSVVREIRQGAEQYLRESLGIFSELESGAEIDYEKWLTLADVESRREGQVCLAVDVSPMRDYASIAVYGTRADGNGHAQVAYCGTPAGIVQRIVQFRDAIAPMAIAMGRGTYESLRVELAQRGITRPEARSEDEHGAFARERVPGDIVVLSAIDNAAACAQIIDAVKDGSLNHVPTPAGNAAVKVARVQRRGDSMAWVTTDRAVDITPVTSLTMARWGYFALLDSVIMEDDYDVADSFG